MTAPVRAVAAAAVAGALGVLGVAGASLAGGAAASVARGASGSARTPEIPLVVVAAVPGLTWADVATMPNVQRLAANGAVASLAVKTVTGTTGCAAGLFAVAAGTRTVQPPGVSAGNCNVRSSPAAVAANAADDYRADIHALGDALVSAGVARVSDGSAAATMLTASHGSPVDIRATPRGAIGVGYSESHRPGPIGPPATSHGAVVALSDPGLVDPSAAQSLSQVDAWVGMIAADTPPGALLILAGTSDVPDHGPQLRVLIERGPAIGHVALRAGRAGRPSYAELIDIAPTITSAFHLVAPAGFDGTDITPSTRAAPSVASLADDNRHATADEGAAVGVRAILITLMSLALLLYLLSMWRAWLRLIAVAVARVCAPIAVLSWLAQLVPWWRTSVLWLLLGLVGIGAVNAWLFARLRRRGLATIAEVVAWPAVTATTLIVDQLVGAPLQLSAPLGDNPLQAGRFTGVGNTDFAVLLGATILVAAVVGGAMLAAGRRWSGLAVATTLLLIAVVVDAAPFLGDDLGGAIAAVPAAIVTVGVLAGWQLSRRRVALVAVGALALGVLAALIDYARPVADQTHLGRFVGQVLHGGAGTVVGRKVRAVLVLQGELPLVLAIIGFFLPAGWRRALSDRLRLVRGGLAAAAGVAVVAVLGSLTNDSGITVMGFVMVAAVPGLIVAT